MSIVAVNDNNFNLAVPAQGTTLVEFGAVWCPPCKALLPILDDLSNKHAEQLTVIKVDCDESPATAGAFGVMSMPTVIVFQDGEPVEKLVGLRPQSVYESVLSKYIAAV